VRFPQAVLDTLSRDSPLDEPCLTRRGHTEERPDGFLHFCVECGRWGAFGYGVDLRKGRLGQWYCAAHRPEATAGARGEQVPAVDAREDGTQTEGPANAAKHRGVGAEFQPLQPADPNWTAEDWRRRFEERANLAVHQHGMPPAAAERLAFERCVVEWLNVNPNPSLPGQCTWCGKPETVNAAVVPCGTEPGTHVWLHLECWSAWDYARKASAMTALKAMGLSRESTAISAKND
jgi:hypothetical protein